MKRRDLLKVSVAVAGTAASGALVPIHRAGAAPLEAPVVDKLSVRMLVDLSQYAFARPTTVNGVTALPPPPKSDFRRSLHAEFGLSLLCQSTMAGASRTVMVDYAYTPDVLLNNFELVGADAAKIDALVISHGHYDHFGGLMGFLDKHRGALPKDVKLYAGGEDNFCHRVIPTGQPGAFSDFGTLDRRALAAKNVGVVLCESPTIIAGQAFTTGMIKRQTDEKILPNTFEEFGIKDGLGCDATHYTPAELRGKTVPDEHYHEHATCFSVRDRGLVVVSSCSHRGIVNAVKQAIEVSGVKKVHAVIGGFHLGPAPLDYTKHIVEEMMALNPDVVVPMHCSGQTFTDAMQAIAPEKLLLASTGALLNFGA
jgi:7,8-dihydropterin-6-yl-methyl-4-(beta-D-ribofuranosyl)aminobenzene 5'-phosphate synthase